MQANNTAEQLEQINAFEAHYDYDSRYMREMLQHAPQAYAHFAAFLPMAEYRSRLPLEDYWVSKIAAMQYEDCGDCLQLNVRLAQEAGISDDLLKALLHNAGALPPKLKSVYDYSFAVAAGQPIDETLAEQLETHYDLESRMELALCIASSKMFPTIKRTLGYARSCRLIEIDI